jgi:hypothetical protein
MENGLQVMPDFKPMLEKDGKGLYQLEVYTQQADGSRGTFVTASDTWTDSGTIKIDRKIFYKKVNNECPKLMVQASEQDLIFDNWTTILEHVGDSSRMLGEKLTDPKRG